MTSTKYKNRKLSLLKYIFSGITLAGLAACGGINKNDPMHGGGGGGQNGGNQGDEEALPDSFQETLNLAGNQLFSLKQDSGSDADLAPSEDATRSLAGHSIDTSNKDAYGLFILDSQGKAKRYLSSGKFERFETIRNGKKVAYLARTKESLEKHRFIPAQWIILKDGEMPVVVKRDKENFSWVGDFEGQTSNGGLVFSSGLYVDLNGKPLSYGKNINKVTRASFVSGDFVVIEREINGRKVTTIVNVKTSVRKGYGTSFAPHFVQITKAGDGLLSDTNKSMSYNDADPMTQISSLKAELDDAGEKRTPAYKSKELNHCLWFHRSIHISGQDAAMVMCYISKPWNMGKGKSGYHGYRLMWVEPNGADWKFTKLKDLTDSEVYGDAKNTFIEGDGYTIIRSGADFFHVVHATKTIQKLTTKFASLFDIRASDDLTKFVVIGEKNNGDQLMRSYNADGSFAEEHEIEIE